jgi:hypothetical protein
MPETVFDDLDTYLGHFAGDMAARVSTGLRPLFDPEVDSLSDAVLSLRDCPGMQPYPAQAVAAEGLLRCLEHIDTAWLNGEMGTGKTPMALWLVRAWMEKTGRVPRVVLTCPNQLTRKWKRHAEKVIPGCRAVIVGKYKDLVRLTDEVRTVTKTIAGDGKPSTQVSKRWADPAQPEVWILPRDRGKLGYAWSFGGVFEETRKTIEDEITGEIHVIKGRRWRCPRCNAVITDKNGLDADREHFVTRRGKLKKKCACQDCKEPLWQAYNGTTSDFADPTMPCPGVSPRRMAPCAYLRQIGARFTFYVADEVHELKGAGTLQGQMFADLCSMSEKRIPLTGTLVGGYAENMLHLLWRTAPFRLVADGLTYDNDGFNEYVERYGVMQTQKRYVGEQDDHGVDLTLGRGRASSSRTKSLPGISPLLFVHYLMDCSVFLRLMEMHAHLPPFEERVHVCQPSPMQDAGLQQMQEDFEEHRERHRPCRAWSAARAAFLRWPDKPWIDEYVIHDEDEDGIVVEAFTVPQLPKQEYPKERRVRRLVQRNLMRGRKTWIFTELAGQDGTPSWDWMDYLAGYLGKHGIRAVILRSQAGGGPKPEDREAWIAKHAKHADVIVSHPALVQTGLDLFEHPSIIFAFPGDNTYRLRQASRRAWRLGQSQPCEVDYVVYASAESRSVQEAALSLMAKKMEASLAIEGDFSSEGLAALSSGDDMATQLAKFIDGQLDDLDPATTAFEKYRRKLEACLPELAKEHKRPDEAPRPEPLIERTPVPPPPVEVAPVPEPEPEPETASFDALRSLGIDVEAELKKREEQPMKQPAAVQAEAFEHEACGVEPKALGDRKRLRLEALSRALGGKPVESNGDRHRFDDQWFHVVAKRRETVRVRNFSADDPETVIAFVEPRPELGPNDGVWWELDVEGVDYAVSFIQVSDYGDGRRESRGAGGERVKVGASL